MDGSDHFDRFWVVANHDMRRKFVFDLRVEKLLFLGVNLVIILLGLFFVSEASALESFRTLSEQQSVWALTLRQIMWAGIGLLGFAGGLAFPKSWWMKLAPLMYGLTLVLLVLVLFMGYGSDDKGANRWLDLGFITFQPSEIAKLTMVIFFAWLFKKSNRPWLLLVFLGVPAVLLALEPDFAGMALMTGTVFIMYILTGARWRNVFLLGLAGLLVLLVVMVAAPYRRERLLTYFFKTEVQEDQSWHANQLEIAFGRGGWLGVGIGNSKQKYQYLPETSSDSIFAIVGEEIGFIGASTLIGLYVLYFFWAWKIIGRSIMSWEYRLMGYGLISLLSLQTLFYFATVTGLIPLTGMTLPFFSRGGTSLVISMTMTGILLALTKSEEKIDKKKREDKRPLRRTDRSVRMRRV